MDFIILTICSYFIGSIPFGMIISLAHGKDLRKIGSGNIGATNLARALGKRWAYFCFLLDVGKGFLPTAVAGWVISKGTLSAGTCGLWLAVGCAAILGHIFPIFLKFKGGKGVATSLGVAMGIYPYFTIPAVLSFLVWIPVVLKWRYISLGSVTGAVMFPVFFVAAVIIFESWEIAVLYPLLAAGIAIPVMVLIRHRKNIARIKNGTESKIKSGGK
jgi:glycerol-3-phosphate acyltransferase PlsY